MCFDWGEWEIGMILLNHRYMVDVPHYCEKCREYFDARMEYDEATGCYGYWDNPECPLCGMDGVPVEE